MLAILTALVVQSLASPAVTVDRTGPGLFIYHRVSVDCGFVEHQHGRNASWGRWTALTSEVAFEVAEAGGGEGRLVLQCRDGDDCIDTGTRRTDPSLSRHEIPFATPDLARDYLDRVQVQLAACPAGAG
jgi:hypothetical protein